MSIVVFIGPTLGAAEAGTLLCADYRPPAAQGDVYRAALDRPWGIAIIDGYFERVPAVWHKEVLWALQRGVHVFGASSMGALRAAELHSFGMLGVGAIFESFRDGELTDDDEVTVAHADASGAHRPMSTAMVDIRATLARAVRERVFDSAFAERLIGLAKSCYYAERSYPKLCEDARGAGLDPKRIDAFRAWLPERAVSLKQADARLLLRSLARWRTEHPEPRASGGRFEYTDAWHQLTRRLRENAARSDETDGHAAILDQLGKRPDEAHAVRARAVSRKLTLLLAERLGLELSADAVPRTIESFRRERGLLTPESTSAWWQRHGLDRAGFLALMEREATIRLVEESLGRDLDAEIIDALRVDGSYTSLMPRGEELETPTTLAMNED